MQRDEAIPAPDNGGRIILEICASSVTSALAAESGGADRVELCDNMAEGGTTSSYATIAKARDLLKIQLYPIIRPRGGDFLYNELEFELMWNEVVCCKKLGCDGVVIGLLAEDGTVDEKRTRWLAELAWPMGVTFHRAFDRAADPFSALEAVIGAGCERILTSGQQPTAPEGAALISQLVQKASGRIAIMAGSGVRVDNMAQLVKNTRAEEYHSTAKSPVISTMQFKNALALLDEAAGPLYDSDVLLVSGLREEADKAWRQLKR